MLPCNPGGHTAYQDTFLSDFLKFYPDHFVLSKSTWDYIVQFCHLNLSICKGLIVPDHLALAGDGTPVQTAAQQRKKRICKCKKNGCSSCNCKRHYSQPDCNWGWDSHRECYFFGYHLYMYVTSDSYSDLPVFHLLERASRHDMLSFLHSFFTMKAYLLEFNHRYYSQQIYS